MELTSFMHNMLQMSLAKHDNIVDMSKTSGTAWTDDAARLQVQVRLLPTLFATFFLQHNQDDV